MLDDGSAGAEEEGAAARGAFEQWQQNREYIHGRHRRVVQETQQQERPRRRRLVDPPLQHIASACRATNTIVVSAGASSNQYAPSPPTVSITIPLCPEPAVRRMRSSRSGTPSSRTTEDESRLVLLAVREEG